MPPGSRLDRRGYSFPRQPASPGNFTLDATRRQYERVMEIANKSAPRLSIRRERGDHCDDLHWDTVSEDFTDTLTQATRLAFGDSDVNSRPARRRQRVRPRLKTN